MEALKRSMQMGAGINVVKLGRARTEPCHEGSKDRGDEAGQLWRPSGYEKPLGSVRVTIPDTQRATGSTAEEPRGKAESMPARDRILALLRSDPTLTPTGLASCVGVTPKGVKFHLDKLRKTGRIRHVGPTTMGRWEVLESESTRP